MRTEKKTYETEKTLRGPPGRSLENTSVVTLNGTMIYCSAFFFA